MYCLVGDKGFNLSYNENFYKEKFCYYADSLFFDVFQLEFVKGNSKDALIGTNNCVISESISKNILPD